VKQALAQRYAAATVTDADILSVHLNRLRATAKPSADGANTVFAQLHEQLSKVKPQMLCRHDKACRVNFVGESFIKTATISFSKGSRVGLHKRFVYVEAIVHESTILSFPPSTRIAHPGAIFLRDYWTVYDSPSDLPCVCYTPYNIGYTNIV